MYFGSWSAVLKPCLFAMCPNLPSLLPFNFGAHHLWLWGKRDTRSHSNFILGLIFFSLFQTHHHMLPYLKTKGNKIKTKDKIEPQHITYVAVQLYPWSKCYSPLFKFISIHVATFRLSIIHIVCPSPTPSCLQFCITIGSNFSWAFYSSQTNKVYVWVR